MKAQKKWIVLWVALFGGLFVVMESIALASDEKGDTLSEVLRYLVLSVPGGIVVGVATFIAFFVWFIPHILAPVLKKNDQGGDDEE